jgi:peptidylprolyl isomerase
VATNKQRREAERRRLQRQLERRREREVRRRRIVLISSIVGTIVVIGIVVGFLVATNNDDKKTTASAKTPASSAPASTSSGPAACGEQQFPKQSVSAAKGAAVTFRGVTVKGAKDLKGKPGVTAKSSAAPPKLEYKDLVVGKGKAANPKSCVTVQYDGVLYKTGSEFDSSWGRGMLAQFSLSGVVPGFTQGIGGTTGVPPMKIGGRRLMILPSALGYGAQGSPPKIPANSALVFVVDLTNVTSAAAAASG